MKRIQLGLLLAGVLYMSSCSDKNTPDRDIIQEEKNIYRIDKQSFSLDKQTKEEPYFLIGYGFDASKSFLSINTGIKGKVLDLTQIDNIEARTSIDRGARTTGQNTNNISKTDVLEEMYLFPNYSTHVNTTTILADLPGQGLHYNYVKSISRAYKLHNSSPSDANAFTEGFAYHIESSTPQKIVELFGTHMIIGCSKGYWFKYIGYIERETETSQLITKEWKSILYCSGGDTDKITLDQSGTVDMQSWQASYDEQENGEFVDFYPSYPIPLYELLPPGDKRIALENYIEEYLK